MSEVLLSRGAQEREACFSSALAAQAPLVAAQDPQGCTCSWQGGVQGSGESSSNLLTCEPPLDTYPETRIQANTTG
jgi:hypothetical protein